MVSTISGVRILRNKGGSRYASGVSWRAVSLLLIEYHHFQKTNQGIVLREHIRCSSVRGVGIKFEDYSY